MLKCISYFLLEVSFLAQSLDADMAAHVGWRTVRNVVGSLITYILSAGAYTAPCAGCETLSRTSLRLTGGALDVTVHTAS